MYCTKCGTEISGTDQFCPKCGSENENYSGAKTENNNNKTEESVSKSRAAVSMLKSIPQKSFILAIAVVVVLAVMIVLVLPLIRNRTKEKSYISYSPSSKYALIDGEGNATFYLSNEVKSFSGFFDSGRSTPDQASFFLLEKGGELKLYQPKAKDNSEMEIAQYISNIDAVSDYNCYYHDYNNELFCYQFSSGTSTDTGIKSKNLTFSAGKTAVAGLDESGQLSIYVVGQEKATAIANIGSEADICAVLDDGSNIIWAEENTNFDVFMLKNDVPERIGTIINKQKYRSIYANFFDNGKSYIIYSPNGASILVSLHGETVKDVSLPGVLRYDGIHDYEGKVIDSEDDSIKQFYITVLPKYNSDEASICHWDPDENSINEVTSGISLNNNLFLEDNYRIVNGKIYYVNLDGDFLTDSLDRKEKSPITITTDVTDMQVPLDGGYAYIKKTGNLYFVSLTDLSYHLNKIASDINEQDDVYLTDNAKLIFYITNSETIEDSYESYGDLYQYTIGEEPTKIAVKICDLYTNDSNKEINSKTPIIRQYVSNEKEDFVFDIGTIEDSEFVIKTNKNEW